MDAAGAESGTYSLFLFLRGGYPAPYYNFVLVAQLYLPPSDPVLNDVSGEMQFSAIYCYEIHSNPGQPGLYPPPPVSNEHRDQ